MAWTTLQKEILDCKKCPLYEAMPFGPILGKGNINAKYLVILEKPSKDDIIVNELAYDFIGELLYKIMSDAGYEKDEYYITSLLKCYTEKIIKQYSSQCISHLKQEKFLINPKTIFVFSKSISKLLLQNKLNIVILPSLYFLYNRGINDYNKVVLELKKAKNVI